MKSYHYGNNRYRGNRYPPSSSSYFLWWVGVDLVNNDRLYGFCCGGGTEIERIVIHKNNMKYCMVFYKQNYPS